MVILPNLARLWSTFKSSNPDVPAPAKPVAPAATAAPIVSPFRRVIEGPPLAPAPRLTPDQRALRQKLGFVDAPDPADAPTNPKESRPNSEAGAPLSPAVAAIAAKFIARPRPSLVPLPDVALDALAGVINPVPTAAPAPPSYQRTPPLSPGASVLAAASREIAELQHRLRTFHKLEAAHKALQFQVAEYEVRRRVSAERIATLQRQNQDIETLWRAHFLAGPTPEQHLRAFLSDETQQSLWVAVPKIRAKDLADRVNEWCPNRGAIDNTIPVLTPQQVGTLLPRIVDSIPGLSLTIAKDRKGCLFTLARTGSPI